jgi:hypothetical protein
MTHFGEAYVTLFTTSPPGILQILPAGIYLMGEEGSLRKGKQMDEHGTS